MPPAVREWGCLCACFHPGLLLLWISKSHLKGCFAIETLLMDANGCATSWCDVALHEARGEELDAWPLWWHTGIASPVSPQQTTMKQRVSVHPSRPMFSELGCLLWACGTTVGVSRWCSPKFLIVLIHPSMTMLCLPQHAALRFSCSSSQVMKLKPLKVSFSWECWFEPIQLCWGLK